MSTSYLELKVLLESKNGIFRDILVSTENNLMELHQAILDAFNFEGKQMASFLLEGDEWQAAAEYPLEALGENDRTPMLKVKIGDVLKAEGDQLVYIYDYMNEWKFHLELIHIHDKSEEKITPALLKSVGKAPDENERNLSGKDAESILMNALLGDELSEEFEDENDDFFDSGDYDSLDDYEEYQ